MAHLVTGYKGEEHIKSSDDGSFNASFFGNGQYVMEAGNQIYASIIDNNTIRVKDGDLLMHGRHIRIETNTYENMTIETGTAGTNRYDLIVMTYEKNASTGKEEARLEVIKGTASTSPTVPSYTKGNILEGAMKNQMPLYKVYIEGVVLKSIECLFTTIPTYKALAEQAKAEFESAVDPYMEEMAEIKKSVGDGKALVANAITEKGVATATDATFATMAGNISNIAVRPELLWTNPNPTSPYAYTGVTLNIEGYQGLIVCMGNSDSTGTANTLINAPFDEKKYATDTNPRYYRSLIYSFSNNQLYISYAYDQKESKTDNAHAIPKYIYGVKYNVGE